MQIVFSYGKKNIPFFVAAYKVHTLLRDEDRNYSIFKMNPRNLDYRINNGIGAVR